MDKHTPVLLAEVIEQLNIKPQGIYVDCTLGRAGHTSAILAKIKTGKVYAFDQDDQAIKDSQKFLKSYTGKYELIKSNFQNIKQELLKRQINKVDGILYDLGISSPQVDEVDRGFSYKNDARLDMRMDQTQVLSAYEVINKYDFQQLKRILYLYGEETFASSIAKNIIAARETAPITTTIELMNIIKKSLPFKVLNKQKHPARKTFQAIRIEVNNELSVLEKSLTDALTLLKSGGRIAVISFHSLEDRIVKQLFKSIIEDPEKDVYLKLPIARTFISKYKIITKKPILPTESEILSNPRARSAKLRVIEKI